MCVVTQPVEDAIGQRGIADQVSPRMLDSMRGSGNHAEGSLYSVREPLAPLSACDRQGKDLMAWLAKRDGLIWEPSRRSSARKWC